MGGVDNRDWLVQKSHIGIRSNKWYFNLFTNCLDVALINAWILHWMVAEKPVTMLSLGCYVTKSYLTLQSASDPKSAGHTKFCCQRNDGNKTFSSRPCTIDISTIVLRTDDSSTRVTRTDLVYWKDTLLSQIISVLSTALILSYYFLWNAKRSKWNSIFTKQYSLVLNTG